MAKVLIIVAKRYNGHELWTLLKRLRVHNHNFEVVSSQTLIRDELTLQPNLIARTLYDVDIAQEIDQFDGVCVVSGNMQDTEAYWTDNAVLKILHTFRDNKKVIAAICCSVPTLAPICKGVRVAPFPLVRSRQRLLRFGAILESVSICVDMENKTITAENQMMSYMWGDCISAVLDGNEPPINLAVTTFAKNFTGKTPRRLPNELEEVLVKFRPTPEMVNKKL